MRKDSKTTGPPTMLELHEAIERILSAVRPLGDETIALKDAPGRILAQSVPSPLDLPVFDNSAMDGYAVRAADLARAGAESPVVLRLTGRVAAGEVFGGTVSTGTCVRLFTGSPLPSGADAVVMQEDTRTDPAAPGQIRFLDAARPWENVRRRGEDVKRGETLVQGGKRLTPGRTGLLAAVGVTEVRVGRKPRLGLLATGSELVEAGRALSPGKIYESNRLMLAPQIERVGGVPRILPLVPDDLAATRESLSVALAECDALVTSGGVSVGEFDFVGAAFEGLGGRLDFWKVSIRPGKPFLFGRAGDKFLFGLPGNPVSAWVTFLLLVRPALLRMQGASEMALPGSVGVLAEPLINQGTRRHFMRVAVDSSGRVHPTGTQASHRLSSLADANGLVDMPPGAAYPAGATVSILHWD